MLRRLKTFFPIFAASLAVSAVLVQPAAAFYPYSLPSDFLGYQSADCGGVDSDYTAMCNAHFTVVRNATTHLPPLDTASQNIPALASYISTCTSTSPGVKGLCMQVSATIKLFQEDNEVLVPLPATFEYLQPIGPEGTSPGFTSEYVAWNKAMTGLAYLLVNDGAMISQSDGFYTAMFDSTYKTIETTDPRWQAMNAAFDTMKAAGDSFKKDTDQVCFSAFTLIANHAKSGDIDSEGAAEVRAALIKCNQAVASSGVKYLAAIDAFDQALGTAAKTGNTAGAQGSGSVLTLPLPLADIKLPELIARVIRQVLSIVGALALAFFVWGGIRWMLARGVPEEVAKAKKIIVAAVSGLFAIFASYAILNFIINALK
jgi:hypothetical protein